MTIADLINVLEKLAPPILQENYDNAGLLTGQESWNCTGVLCTLDATENVILEARARHCNLIVAHHPIIFGGLKKITGRNYVERAIIAAIKNDIAIYAIHTNLDNIISGVNGRMAHQLGLVNTRILKAGRGTLKKLFSFVPNDQADRVRDALFAAGAGHIGNYSECSFGAEGMGTFKAGEATNPYVGEKGQRHSEKELKIEVVFPAHLQSALLQALLAAHPYEEVAYDVVDLANPWPGTGSGLQGELPTPITENEFLQLLKKQFRLSLIRHTAFTGKPIRSVALCGGAGSFLISNALSSGADVFVSADIKYHEFFDANGQILICDIGHFESEQFTVDLLAEVLQQKFPTFAVLKSDQPTNPVYYYF